MLSCLVKSTWDPPWDMLVPLVTNLCYSSLFPYLFPSIVTLKHSLYIHIHILPYCVCSRQKRHYLLTLPMVLYLFVNPLQQSLPVHQLPRFAVSYHLESSFLGLLHFHHHCHSQVLQSDVVLRLWPEEGD